MAAAAVVSGSAWAQPPAAGGVDRAARAWASTCAACHGTEGRPQAGFPLLAGRPAEQLVAALTEFRDGRRPEATIMHQHAKGYTDEEIGRIANYFASLPMEAPQATNAAKAAKGARR